MKIFITFASIILISQYYVEEVSSADCYYEDTGHYWAAGTTYTPIGKCTELTCFKGESYYGKPCPLYPTAPPGCKLLPRDLTKPYPDCCEKVKCP